MSEHKFNVGEFYDLYDGRVVKITGVDGFDGFAGGLADWPIKAEVVSMPGHWPSGMKDGFGIGANDIYTISGRRSLNEVSPADIILSSRRDMAKKPDQDKMIEPADPADIVFTTSMETETFDNHFPMMSPGFEQLARVLHGAYNQAANGKGQERHGSDGAAFHEQPMATIADMPNIGGAGLAYQIIKKAHEAVGMHERGETEKAIHEVGGVIVYAAGLILHFERAAAKRNKG